jgi:expansin (peptidoglycan-binding protein)
MSSRARLLAVLLPALALGAACRDWGDEEDRTAGACASGPSVAGTLSLYASAGAGASACQPSTLPANHVALSPALFADAAACGACVEIVGPRGMATATVVDVCPSCAADALDASEETWVAVADSPALTTVTWRTVACPAAGPIRYRSCAETSPSFLCLVAEDHRFPLASVEVLAGGATSFVALARDGANQWTHAFGAATEGPFTVRATDVHGHELVDAFGSLSAGTVATGAADFPATCP